jgi:transcriptional regulator with XRE-family HTH domain
MIAKTIDEARKIIGYRLKDLTKNKSLKHKELSKATGLARSTISSIFNGHQTPTIDTLYKFQKELDFDMRKILDGLEYWISLKNFKFSSKDFSEEERRQYYEKLYKQIDLIKSSENERQQSDNSQQYEEEYYLGRDSKGEFSIRKISSDTFTVFDNSMDLLGFKIKDIVSYLEEAIDKNDISYKKIYVVKFKSKDRRSILRKIYLENDSIIAIPYATRDYFKPESFHEDDIKGIYETTFVKSFL